MRRELVPTSVRQWKAGPRYSPTPELKQISVEKDKVVGLNKHSVGQVRRWNRIKKMQTAIEKKMNKAKSHMIQDNLEDGNMIKRKKIRETFDKISNMGITPTQTGSVPTPPPHAGSGTFSDEETNTPRIIDLNGRSRQLAASRLKRKFESRYGSVNEQTPRPSVIHLGGSSDPMKAYRDYQEKIRRDREAEQQAYIARERAARADRMAKGFAQQFARPTLKDKMKDWSTTFNYDAPPPPGVNFDTWVEQRRQQRRKEQGLPYTDVKTKEDDVRSSRLGRDVLRGKARELKTFREEPTVATPYSASRLQYAPVGTFVGKDNEGKRFTYKGLVGNPPLSPEETGPANVRGIFGRGKQKEADEIAVNLQKWTRFKNITIKPYGSGMRVKLEARMDPNRPTPDIRIYLQRQMKVVLFDQVQTKVPIYLVQALRAIRDSLPTGWKMAMPPIPNVMRNIANISDPEKRNLAQRSHKILISFRSEDPDMWADRLEYNRARRDWEKSKDKAGEAETGYEQDKNYRPDPRPTLGLVGAAGSTGSTWHAGGGPNWSPGGGGETPPPPPPPEPDEEDIPDLGGPRPDDKEWVKSHFDISKEEDEPGEDELAAMGFGTKKRYKPFTSSSAFGTEDPTSKSRGTDIFGMDFDLGGGTSSSATDQPTANLGGQAQHRAYATTGFTDDEDTISRAARFNTTFGRTVDLDPDEDWSKIPDEKWKEMGVTIDPNLDPKGRKLAINAFKQQQKGRFRGTEPAAPTVGPTIHPKDVTGPGAHFDPETGEYTFMGGDTTTYWSDAQKVGKATLTRESPAAMYIASQASRLGKVSATDQTKNKVRIRTEGLTIDVVRTTTGGKPTVTAKFMEIYGPNILGVIDLIPQIAFPASGGSGRATYHKNDLTPLFDYMDKNGLHDYFPEAYNRLNHWLKNRRGQVVGIRSLNKHLADYGYIERKSGPKKDKAAKRQKNESKSAYFSRMIINEQSWYKEHVQLAKKIQKWILVHLGGYQVTKQQIHNEFDGEHEPEAVDKAIEILRANAAIYPMTNDVYMLNMTRLSSANI